MDKKFLVILFSLLSICFLGAAIIFFCCTYLKWSGFDFLWSISLNLFSGCFITTLVYIHEYNKYKEQLLLRINESLDCISALIQNLAIITDDKVNSINNIYISVYKLYNERLEEIYIDSETGYEEEILDNMIHNHNIENEVLNLTDEINLSNEITTLRDLIEFPIVNLISYKDQLNFFKKNYINDLNKILNFINELMTDAKNTLEKITWDDSLNAQEIQKFYIKNLDTNFLTNETTNVIFDNFIKYREILSCKKIQN